MRAVRTALGKLEHLAADEGLRTFCGREFSPGFDSTRQLERDERPENLCRSCAATDHRRRLRNAKYDVA